MLWTKMIWPNSYRRRWIEEVFTLLLYLEIVNKLRTRPNLFWGGGASLATEITNATISDTKLADIRKRSYIQIFPVSLVLCGFVERCDLSSQRGEKFLMTALLRGPIESACSTHSKGTSSTFHLHCGLFLTDK